MVSLGNSFATTVENVPDPPPRTLQRTNATRTLKAMTINQLWEAGKRIVLPKLMSRPTGCTFMGARATTTQALIGRDAEGPTNVIIDSGSDITLISTEALRRMNNPPRIQTGQKISLVQVTGKTSIRGYVEVPLIFETDDGPVEMPLEAYVVKGMNAEFILGNDFADQFALSIIRRNGETHLVFGDSGRRKSVENSIGPTFTDQDGHSFRIMLARRELEHVPNNVNDVPVKSAETVTIQPGSAKIVTVSAVFPSGVSCVYVEKVVNGRKGDEDLLIAPDSLVQTNDPFLHVSNFSDRPLTLQKGETVGLLRDPRSWLEGRLDDERSATLRQHAYAVRTLVQEVRKLDKDEDQDVAETFEEIGEGPKTAELPDPEPVASEALLSSVDLPSHLTSEQREALEKIVISHKDAFGLDGKLGHYNAKVRIPLRSDAKEVSLPPYGASPAKREAIDRQLDVWLSQEVIEPSESPWGFPVLIVYRNGKPRMCVDYRRLNAMTVPDEFPLPKQSDITQALTGSQWLSSLDALSGFTQLEIVESDRPKTAFRTHRGLHQFRRLPFGLRNGPSVFQRVMQNVLAPYLWTFALVYIDDVVVYSRTFTEHLQHLDSVLGAIERSGLTLSPSKCHFGYQSLLLLGQKVSRLGMSTHREKVDAIIALREPQNVADLRTFLGMMVYFAAYIPFFAWIAQPLFALLKKDTAWAWGELEREAWTLCKESLIRAPVRAYAIPGRGYRLYTDACDYGLAGILQQVQPMKVCDLKGTKSYERIVKAREMGEGPPTLVNNSHIPEGYETKSRPDTWAEEWEQTEVYVERVIAYWSRVLKPAERNYSPTEREALALKESLVKFQGYLEGEKIVAITDHAALTWSRTFQNVNRRLMSWGLVFSAYPEMIIVHRAGRVHSNVDPISRLKRRIPHQEGPALDSSAEIRLSENGGANETDSSYQTRVQELVKQVGQRPGFAGRTTLRQPHIDAVLIETPVGEVEVNTSAVMSSVIAISNEEIRAFQDGYQRDPYFRFVLADLKEERDWSKPKRPEFRLGEEGLLYYENWAGHSRLCVPETKRCGVLEEVHEGLCLAAHGGYYRTYNRIASAYYWPRMGQDIRRFVSSCDTCQKVKIRRHLPYGLLQPIPIPSQPFEVVSMDFIPELPESNGYNNILVIVDKLTKYAVFVPTSTSVNESETAKLFFRHIYVPYGLPKQIISDRDSRWSNSFWKALTELVGSKRALTTAHHPQADGQTEILNQFLEVGLRTFVNEARDNWADLVAGFEHAYNCSVHRSTGYSPAYLLRGYEPNELVHLNGGRTDAVPRMTSGNLDAEEFNEGMRANLLKAQTALHLAQEHQRASYNQGRLAREYEEGDLVLINPHSMNLTRDLEGKGRKLLPRYEGPFEIIRKLSPITYQIRIPSSYKIHPVISIAHLEPYEVSPAEFGPRNQRPSMRPSFKDLPELEIESIIAERNRVVGRQRRKEYRVRFKGGVPNREEWLDERHLVNAPHTIQDWKAKNSPVSIIEQGDASLSTSNVGKEPERNTPSAGSRRSGRIKTPSIKIRDSEEWVKTGIGRIARLRGGR